VNKITPSFSQGCFCFPTASWGVDVLIANIFQTLKHLLSPANLCRKICKIVEAAEERRANKGRESLPFERSKKKASG